MTYRMFVGAGLLIASSLVGTATHSTAQASAQAPAVQPPLPPVASSIPTAKPRPAAPMQRMPPGSTTKDYQKALAAYAAKSGQTYAVDSSAFDPVNRVQTTPLAGEPDVPSAFTYLDVGSCRDLGQSTQIPPVNGIGRIYNHYQWCGWVPRTTYYQISNQYGTIDMGAIWYRLTIIGWGSQSSNEMTVRVYVDQVNAPEGSLLTPGNTTLTVKPSCDNVIWSGTCSFSDPAPGATFLDLSNGRMLEFIDTVTLPPATPDNPDRVAGLNLNVRFEVTSTAMIGKIVHVQTVTPAIRCDSSTRGGISKPGCIFGGVTPQYSLNRNDPVVKEIAEHVYWALTDPNSTTPPYDGNKLIPGSLSRIVDQETIDVNRGKAEYQCDKWLAKPRPLGKECDEYPFATVLQGAADLETNFSVALVDGDQNGDEGTRRGLWYKDDRILENDWFNVVAY